MQPMYSTQVIYMILSFWLLILLPCGSEWSQNICTNCHLTVLTYILVIQWDYENKLVPSGRVESCMQSYSNEGLGIKLAASISASAGDNYGSDSNSWGSDIRLRFSLGHCLGMLSLTRYLCPTPVQRGVGNRSLDYG